MGSELSKVVHRENGGERGGERTLSPFHPLFIPRFFILREFFSRAILFERLEQANLVPRSHSVFDTEKWPWEIWFVKKERLLKPDSFYLLAEA